MPHTPNGRFVKGVRRSPKTEFKKGQHWRKKQPWWEKVWLVNQYVTLQRSASEIAKEYKVHENAILYWIGKHGIPTRSVSEARRAKPSWKILSGDRNPMYGVRGVLNKNWRGGLTPFRQKMYSRFEWKQFMREVWARDKKCRLCGSRDKCEIHHIDPFSQSPLLIMDIGNVILLCSKCHKSLRGKENRWKKRLFAIIQKANA